MIRYFDLLEETKDELRTDLPRPSEITDFSSTFGSDEVEEAAERLVMFFRQVQGNMWRRFTLHQLIRFYKQHKWDINGMFFGLAGPYLRDDDSYLEPGEPPAPFVVCVHSTFFVVTEDFVRYCARNLPMRGQA